MYYDRTKIILTNLQVLTSDPDNGWRMVTIDENKPRGLAPPFFQRILKTAWFHISILLLVLANAIVTATIHFDHYKIDPYKKIDEYYYAEVMYKKIDQYYAEIMFDM